jgi:hypothetical protein
MYYHLSITLSGSWQRISLLVSRRAIVRKAAARLGAKCFLARAIDVSLTTDGIS